MKAANQPAAAAPAEPEVQDDKMGGDAGHKHPEPVHKPKPQKGAYGARVRPQK
jgi:hypothetical protein